MVISTEEAALARSTADELAAGLREAMRRGTAPRVELLGPAPSPIPRLRGKHRVQMLLKAADLAAVRGAARHLSEQLAKLPRGVQASLDLNPGNML